ncbi:MAG: glutaredoxin-like protein [Halobacteriales archaeon]|jgi:glutaredoxin-like protein
MAFISEDDRPDVKEQLDGIEEPVTIHLFTEDDCQYCDETIELNRELAALHEDLTLEQHDLRGETAEKWNADKYDGGPVAILSRDGNSNVRYFGIPSGHEFPSYLEDIVEVSTGETTLDEDLVSELEEIDEEVDITVFVTPTCPHCPRAVRTAHSFAMANDNITGEMVESQEFMELSQEFGVRSVPQINVNGEAQQFTGALPPEQFLEQVKSAL